MDGTPDARARLARGLAEIHNPLAFARRYLAHRHLLGGPDEDDLMDVAIGSIVDAALAWHPGAGRSMLSWAWLYLDRNISRELGRCGRRRHELVGLAVDGDETPVDPERWLRYDPGHDPYERAALRVDLQRWADLAELNPLMRSSSSTGPVDGRSRDVIPGGHPSTRVSSQERALHTQNSTQDDFSGTAPPKRRLRPARRHLRPLDPPRRRPHPLHGAGHPTLTRALGLDAHRGGHRPPARRHRWTRHRASYGAAEARSSGLLARLRAVEDDRDAVIAGARAR